VFREKGEPRIDLGVEKGAQQKKSRVKIPTVLTGKEKRWGGTRFLRNKGRSRITFNENSKKGKFRAFTCTT